MFRNSEGVGRYPRGIMFRNSGGGYSLRLAQSSRGSVFGRNDHSYKTRGSHTAVLSGDFQSKFYFTGQHSPTIKIRAPTHTESSCKNNSFNVRILLTR
jgi:hypothetical protein